jgi:hypothetical protein
MTLGNYQNHDKISAIRYEHPALTKDNPIILKPKGQAKLAKE